MCPHCHAKFSIPADRRVERSDKPVSRHAQLFYRVLEGSRQGYFRIYVQEDISQLVQYPIGFLFFQYRDCAQSPAHQSADGSAHDEVGLHVHGVQRSDRSDMKCAAEYSTAGDKSSGIDRRGH